LEFGLKPQSEWNSVQKGSDFVFSNDFLEKSDDKKKLFENNLHTFAQISID
jgi:hypothetical protein